MTSEPLFAYEKKPGGQRGNDDGGSGFSKRDDSLGLDWVQWNGVIADLSGTDFTYLHAKLTVPSLPTNASTQVLWYQISLLNEETGDGLGWGLQYGSNEEYGGFPDLPLFSVYSQIYSATNLSSPLAQSNPIAVNPGDVVDSVLEINGDFMSITLSVNNGPISRIGSNTTLLTAKLSAAGFGFWTWGADNCNTLPSSNQISFSDISIKDAGEFVTPSWTYVWTENPCAISVTSDAVSGSMSWDSADWTGNYQTCAYQAIIAIENQWVDGSGVEQYQFRHEIWDWSILLLRLTSAFHPPLVKSGACKTITMVLTRLLTTVFLFLVPALFSVWSAINQFSIAA
eukprot:TRINITY_DN5979_c0_g1_i10.p1 TRINITY_DN5979_c0_g1~~TRINITY_DN5979_c0_g1_i10.p1  ORF type:complete len:341 (+),score=41.23 TRINITY_DN5979_c0_g1_i10:804-1826(+)